MAQLEYDILEGSVENVTFCNEANGFCVFEISCEQEIVTVVGAVGDVFVGEQIVVKGYWDFHPSFGRQFHAESCERQMPQNAADMLRYLGSGAVRGVGPATARRIVDTFGDSTFEILEKHSERLAQIKGISAQKAEMISKSFNDLTAVRQVMIYLERYGMTNKECLNAYQALGAEAVSKIVHNPYILCNDTIGMSFERACSVAVNLPNPVEDAFRIRAGIIHVLKYNVHNGFTCIPRDKLAEPCSQLLDVSCEVIQSALDGLLDDKQLFAEMIHERQFIFLPELWIAEKSIADRMKIMLKFPPAGRMAIEQEIRRIEIKNGIEYEEKQKLAISTAIQKGLLILTGGPGTGKTTTLNGILELFERDGLDVCLCAPTGRAAKRMSDITTKEAKTIHRLLEVEWGKGDKTVFVRNASNPIAADAVIVDELSMVDVRVFAALVDALPLGCRLVLVGDSDQLPPVGAGNVLSDLIHSGIMPVVCLTQVFRQAMRSLIVTNAHRIVKGEMPVLDRIDSDFFFLNRVDPAATAQTVVDLIANRLPKAYGFHPLNDIQILCPSRKGEVGTMNLNRSLQQTLNPSSPKKPEFQKAGSVFRRGDKVMQIKNNYDLTWSRGHETGSGVYNGDIGLILDINIHNNQMRIMFDDREVNYPLDNIDELELAYACTVHKSQGSEFEAVILPLCATVSQLSYRNLLYTAVTRAKSKLIIVGTAQQIRLMVENDKKTRRYSALTYFLCQ